MNDLRLALRLLLKHPGFTAVAGFTLAVGLAANVTVFSLVNAILLRPFPAADPERLVTISVYDPKHGASERGATSLPDLLALQEGLSSFARLFGMYSDGIVLAGDGGAERVQGSVVSPNFLEVLGLRPVLGREFLEEDGEPGSEAVLLISHGLWQQRFGGQADLQQLTARINGGTARIVGVMPPGFRFPVESDIWMPLRRNPEAPRGNRYLKVVGRLGAGSSQPQADAEVKALMERLSLEHPTTNRDLTAAVYELRGLLLPGPVRLLLWLLLGAVGCVLLITCANVAGLILMRGWSRRKELAVRVALGASRPRLVRLLLTESLVLAALGGLAGVGMAGFVLEAVRGLIPVGIPYWVQFTMDWRVAVFAVTTTVLAGLGAGLVPGWQAIRGDPADGLKESAATSTARRPQQRLRQGLVIGEVAVSFALLIGAALMIRSFLATQHAALGFETNERVTFQLALPGADYPTQADKARFAQRVIERLEARPEFVTVGALHPSLPLGDFTSASMYVPVGWTDDQAQNAGNLHVVGEALEALGVRLIRGRLFEPLDVSSQRSVCLVNQTMAARCFPGENPVGQRLRFRGTPDDSAMEIVGVVGDVRRNSIHEKPENQVIRPFEQVGWGGTFAVVARTRAEPARLWETVRKEVAAVDAGVAVHDLRTLEDFVTTNDSYWIARLNGWLFGCLGAAALVIALTGLYGVVAFAVGQRSKEFGVRLALGATRGDIARLVLGQGARLAAAGLGVGLALALALAQLLRGMLFEVTPVEPWSYAGALLLTGWAVLLACWFPARRAAQVDPMTALRSE